jgi:diguanylate cyclase (GGDEF)-like protein
MGMKGFSDPLANHGAFEHVIATGKTTWSAGMYRMHGVAPEEFEPEIENVTELVHPDDLSSWRHAVRGSIASGSPFSVQHRIIRPGGEVRVLMVKGAHVLGADGVDRLVGTTEDVTGRTGHEERLWYLANHDTLTDLFNRRRFMEELSRELAFSMRSGQAGAVIMLDLDNFKDINDSLGHLAGDVLLRRLGETLRGRLRGTDTLARLGGDEFAMVLPDCSVSDAERIAHEIGQDLLKESKIRIGGLEREISAAIGIAPYEGGVERTADELLVEADLAMYRAKNAGRAGVEVFDQQLRNELADRMNLEGELADAIEGDQLWLVYQPLVDLENGTTVGCEALVRWTHPERGLVPPSDFISLAEETGLINPLGAWVLREACEQAARWRCEGREIYISVNVSPYQLTDESIVGIVADALAATSLPAHLLCIEITESLLSRAQERIVSSLKALKELGVQIAIDDFGGGASSFARMRLLPFDQIKVDRLFVDGIDHRADDRAIISAVLTMARELDFSVLAEGVETESQQEALRELGCRYAQGYLYSKPLPAAELELDAGVLPRS